MNLITTIIMMYISNNERDLDETRGVSVFFYSPPRTHEILDTGIICC